MINMAKKKIPPVFGTPEYIKDSAKFLKLIGITRANRPLMPVFEFNYIKFMSDGGFSDVTQAKHFEAWLIKNKLQYKPLSERSFSLSSRASSVINQIWDKFEIDNYGCVQE